MNLEKFSQNTVMLYEYFDRDEVRFYNFLDTLFKNYKKNKEGLKLPNPTLFDVTDYLHKNFNAKEIVDDSFLGLIDDIQLTEEDKNSLNKILVIDDLEILYSLYHETEKEMFQFIRGRSKEILLEYDFNFYIVLHSEDGILISGSQLIGYPKKLRTIVDCILKKNKEIQENLENPAFCDYIIDLWIADFIREKSVDIKNLKF